MLTYNEKEEFSDFSFKSLFTPLTTVKAIHWLVIIGIVVFFNSLLNGFVMDDQGQILANPSIQSFNLVSLLQGSTFGYGNYTGGMYYRPVQNIVFSFLYNIGGAQPFAFHLTQVVLHTINSILFFLLFKKYLQIRFSFILALIFLVHPMQVEAVAYIACMQDVLFVFFGLLFIHTLPLSFRSKKLLIPSTLFLLLSLLSKESGIAFLILGYVYIFLFGRKKQLAMHVATLFGVLLLYGIFRFVVGGVGIHTQSEFSMMRLSTPERLMHIPLIVLYYLKTFFFPINLVAVQSWIITSLTIKSFFIPLLIVSGFLGGLKWISYRICKDSHALQIILFFWTWFLVGLGLHMQIFPLDATVADRWFYFSMIGFLGLLGYIFEKTILQYNVRKNIVARLFVLCMIIFISSLSYRTIIRNFDWKDTKTLALHDLQYQKDNDRLLSALGGVYLEEEEYEKAMHYLEQSIAIYPHWSVSMYNLGVAYHMTNHPKEAKMYYEKAIAIAPNYVYAHENLAILYLKTQSSEDAKKFAEESLQKFPQSLKLQRVLLYAEQKTASQSGGNILE